MEFCDSDVIEHYICDAYPLFKISCMETWLIEQVVILSAVLTFIMTLVCVVLSYTYIIKTILQFPSAQQRKKAFSTCSSHMIVISITYGSCIFVYVNPSAKDSVTQQGCVSPHHFHRSYAEPLHLHLEKQASQTGLQ
jgi:olfactory receptor